MALTIYSRRRRRKRWARLSLWLFALLCLGVGLYFGLHHPSGPSSVRRDVPFFYYLKSQFLFAGAIDGIDGFYGFFPSHPESEGESEDSLIAWDVAYDEDAFSGEMIPVFISNSEEGGDVTDLVRREAPGNLDLVAIRSAEPEVLIYCTHTAESYAGNRKDANGRGDVLKVAHHL